MTVHDFQESLARSHAEAEAPWWIEVYRRAFPGLQSAVCVRGDGWAQRGGIDRVLTLGSGKTLAVDEKVRERDWPDILLEYWSSVEHRKPGWIAKDLACDFLAYAFVPSQRCYLLPFPTLRRAWTVNGREWVRRYGHRDAKNHGYTTRSVPVPTAVVMAALSGAMEVSWRGAA